MQRVVVLNRRAFNDAAKARRWYEREQVGLGVEFIIEVEKAIVLLEHPADQYPPYYRDVHRLLLHRFPYKIFFRIKPDVVRVLRILHSARDPTSHLS